MHRINTFLIISAFLFIFPKQANSVPLTSIHTAIFQSCVAHQYGIECWGGSKQWSKSFLLEIDTVTMSGAGLCAGSLGEYECWGQKRMNKLSKYLKKYSNIDEIKLLDSGDGCLKADAKIHCWKFKESQFGSYKPVPFEVYSIGNNPRLLTSDMDYRIYFVSDSGLHQVNFWDDDTTTLPEFEEVANIVKLSAYQKNYNQTSICALSSSGTIQCQGDAVNVPAGLVNIADISGPCLLTDQGVPYCLHGGYIPSNFPKSSSIDASAGLHICALTENQEKVACECLSSSSILLCLPASTPPDHLNWKEKEPTF